MSDEKEKKEYKKPEIILELDLETKAGSVFPPPCNFVDISGIPGC